MNSITRTSPHAPHKVNQIDKQAKTDERKQRRLDNDEPAQEHETKQDSRKTRRGLLDIYV